MRKMDGKVKMFGLYAVICAGMLLFTGCTGTNMSDMGTENGAAEKEAANYQIVILPLIPVRRPAWRKSQKEIQKKLRRRFQKKL